MGAVPHVGHRAGHQHGERVGRGAGGYGDHADRAGEPDPFRRHLQPLPAVAVQPLRANYRHQPVSVDRGGSDSPLRVDDLHADLSAGHGQWVGQRVLGGEQGHRVGGPERLGVDRSLEHEAESAEQHHTTHGQPDGEAEHSDRHEPPPQPEHRHPPAPGPAGGRRAVGGHVASR